MKRENLSKYVLVVVVVIKFIIVNKLPEQPCGQLQMQHN
jgi:hypothetical protein